MPNVTKKNLIIIKSMIVWKWNHFFIKNYFRKKKINYCYGLMPGDFQVICGSMVGENCWSPASTETLDMQQYSGIGSLGELAGSNLASFDLSLLNRVLVFFPLSGVLVNQLSIMLAGRFLTPDWLL